MNEHQRQVHDTIAQVAYDQILADNPMFAPLYDERRAFMLEQGYGEHKAEEEAHRFVCAEILAWLWCECHNLQWIPYDPRDIRAHTYEQAYPEKGIA